MQLKAKRRRFTMVECIIVIVVLAVVAVLIGTWVSRRRITEARRNNCAGNLKQLGLGLLMYSGDFDGYFPLEPTASASFEGFHALKSQSYIANGHVWYCPAGKIVLSEPHRGPSKAEPGETIVSRSMIGPSTYRYIGSGLKDDSPAPRTTSLVYDQYGNHPNNEWVNVLFIDGHVQGAKPGTAPWAHND